jgi:hypothetical protein
MISNPVGRFFIAVEGARPLHCAHCGEPFKRKRKTAIYCSSNCREKASNLRAARRNRIRSPQPKNDLFEEAGKQVPLRRELCGNLGDDG